MADDRERLSRLLYRSTVTIALLITASVGVAAFMVARVTAGESMLPEPLNVALIAALATSILATVLIRTAVQIQLRQLVLRQDIAVLVARVDAYEQHQDHRDGRLYAQMKFTHSVAIGAITERNLERDTEQLPRAVGGGVYGVAAIPTPPNVTALPSPGTVAAMRRLARKVADLD